MRNRLYFHRLTAAATGPYLRLGVIALLFGAAMLLFNLASEYIALNSAADEPIALSELPTTESMSRRLIGTEATDRADAHLLNWGPVLSNQLYGIGRSALPYFLSFHEEFNVTKDEDYLAVILGGLALAVCAVGLAVSRFPHRILLLTLVVSGFCWGVPLRRFTLWHEFQFLFYIGVPLTAYAFALLYIKLLQGRRLLPTFAIAALLLFVASSSAMADVGQDETRTAQEHEMMQDALAIRAALREHPASTIYIPAAAADAEFGGAPLAASYFLAGHYLEYDDALFRPQLRSEAATDPAARRQQADYIITRTRETGVGLLTPDNKRLFLYNRTIYDGAYDEQFLGEPLIAADWNVYVLDDSVIYISADCSNLDDTGFLFHIYPVDAADLGSNSQEAGFNNQDFPFEQFAVRQGDRCVARRPLPDYPIALIRTGQYNADRRLWEGELAFPP